MKSWWNIQSHFYHALRLTPGIRGILESEKSRLRELLPQSGLGMSTVLDIGSGTGTSLDIYPSFVHIIAVDRSMAMLKKARQVRGDISPVIADAYALPIRTSGIVFCSCIGVTEYLSFKPEFMAEIRRILYHSGQCLLTAARLSFFNKLRNLLGHRLYLLSFSEWSDLFKQNKFKLAEMRSTWLQIQLLLVLQ
jgi:ubiquinone/menaquinone biosynthesis C-methylase UbiE